MNQFPVTWAALGILFRLGWVIERKLDVMEGTQVMVFQNGNTMTVGSDGELHRSSSQVSQYSLVVRMHSVLARSQIHGANRKALHHRLDLFERETVGASGIAVAEGAGLTLLIHLPPIQVLHSLPNSACNEQRRRIPAVCRACAPERRFAHTLPIEKSVPAGNPR